jgi:hypothetical protein
MKKIFMLFITTIFIFSCSEEKKDDSKNLKNSVTETEKIDTSMSDFNRTRVQIDAEEIEILSIIYGIQKDTLNNIILDYLNSTPLNFDFLNDSLPKGEHKYEKIIDSLSSVYKVKKTDFAKIIYDYKFKKINE